MGIYALWARQGLADAHPVPGVSHRRDPALPSLPPQTFRRSSPNGRSSLTSPTMSPPALRPWPRSSVCPTGEVQAGLDALLGRDLVVRQGRSYRLRA